MRLSSPRAGEMKPVSQSDWRSRLMGFKRSKGLHESSELLSHNVVLLLEKEQSRSAEQEARDNQEDGEITV